MTAGRKRKSCVRNFARELPWKYMKAVKHTYNDWSIYGDNGYIESDKKLFLMTDLGLNNILCYVHLLIF